MKFPTHEQTTHRLNVLTTGVALFITFVLLLAYQYVSGKQQLSEELRTEAAIIAANSSAALVFQDRLAAQEILDSTRLTPRIVGGALYRADGQLLAFINDPSRIFPGMISKLDPKNDDHQLPELRVFQQLIRQDVFQDRTRVGTLLLLVSYESLYLKMLEYLVSLLLIGSVALFLTQHFTARLRKQVALTEEQLELMALYDRVTGLPNRRHFERELRKLTERVKREKTVSAVMFIDVDDFKKVNDLCGHEAGDQVLLMIAERLRKTVRSQDVIARVGGDEFALILFGINSPERTALIANAMIAALATPFPTKPIPSHVGISIGITMVPSDSDDPITVMRWSDMAMYVAKSQGKNRYQFFSEQINTQVHGELRIEAELRQALEKKERGLFAVYQPQVCAQTRRVVGVEVLMRWQSEDGRLLSPGDFIPIAEKSGLITQLGAWLLVRVCNDLADLRKLGIEIPKVAINLSPRELKQGKQIVDDILDTLRRAGETIGRFQFEITENALIADNASEVLEAMHQAGLTLAIDDFGSVYSSLGYLKRFNVSTLKIDRQFVQPLPDNEEDAAIVTAVIQMSSTLGIKVVAEGVETDAQADFLAQHGCDTLQGFLTGRPMPISELAKLIKGQDDPATPEHHPS